MGSYRLPSNHYNIHNTYEYDMLLILPYTARLVNSSFKFYLKT